MNQKQTPLQLEELVASWLRAEAGDASDAVEVAAESALGALFAGLPSPQEPAPGFVDAVLRRAGLVRVTDLSWPVRFMTAAALALMAAGSFWLLPWVVGVASLLDPATVLTAWAEVTTFVFSTLGGLVHWGARVLILGRALWLVTLTPPVLVLLAASGILSFVMGRWLTVLLTAERSALHAAR